MKRTLVIIAIMITFLVVWRMTRFRNIGQSSIVRQVQKVFKQNSDASLPSFGSNEKPPSSNPFAIENLRKRTYEGSEITVEQTLSENSIYTAYRVSYLSDDLKIFAAMNIPKGEGPFPVIVLNHGYFNPASFNTGDGTRRMADILAANGYLTLASDYRGHGESESGGIQRGHRPEYSVDVLNLIASVKNVEKADESKIGVWGHSMGGEVTLKVLEVNEQVKAAVLWAPTSGNVRKNYERWVLRLGGDQVQHQERSSIDIPDKQTFDETSSSNYLNYISAPIQLHHGTADTEVPYDWSVELNKNLMETGKNVEFFTYEGQDHNFKNFGWGKISPRTVKFFDKYLMDQVEPGQT